MHGKCECFKFDDVMYPRLCRFNTRQLHFSHLDDISIGKINDFCVVGKCSKVVCTFDAGTRKLLQDFWPPLIPCKVVMRLWLFFRRCQIFGWWERIRGNLGQPEKISGKNWAKTS